MLERLLVSRRKSEAVALESGLWKWLGGILPPGHFSRIESPITPGLPDVYFNTGGFRGWLELKVARRAKAKTPFRTYGLRDSQIKWIKAEIGMGGGVWIIAQVGREVFFVPGTLAPVFKKLTLEALRVSSDLILVKTQAEKNRKALEKFFYGKIHPLRIASRSFN